VLVEEDFLNFSVKVEIILLCSRLFDSMASTVGSKFSFYRLQEQLNSNFNSSAAYTWKVGGRIATSPSVKCAPGLSLFPPALLRWVSISTSAFNWTCGQSARPRPITSVKTKAEGGHSPRLLAIDSPVRLRRAYLDAESRSTDRREAVTSP